MTEWIGRYQILETLGKGGMGVVYRARDPELEREVAIKVVLSWAQYDDDAMARFHREARVVAQLQHPHIVTVFDAGRTDDGLPYFVMEYLEGTDLGRVLDELGSLPPTRAVGYVRQVCDGLSYAHARDIVHRDIKPANLLITPDDHLKIVDFGIAKLVGAQITGSGVSLGTPLYMAPEQVAGGHVDNRADIFAVGGVLYTLLAGRSPFDGPTMGAICHKIESEPPPPLADLGVDIDPRLEAIIRRALEKAPESRYQSAYEMADALSMVSVDLEAAASAPTVVTPKPTAAVPRAGAEVGTQPRRWLGVWVALALIAAAGLLWAVPGSPLRFSEREEQFAEGESAAEGGGAAEAAGEPTAGSGPGGEESSEGPETGAGAGAETEQTEAAASGSEGSEAAATTTTREDPTAEAGPDVPDTEAPPSLYPASAQERAAVNRIVATLVRGLERKDSTAVARAFGGDLTPLQWRAFERLFAGPRMKIRYRLANVASTADGRVVAEVHNDILFQGPPRRVPPPRKATWVMRFQSDRYGGLQLQSLRPR